MCFVNRGYEVLKQAADLGHQKSMEMVAEAYLFGDHVQQNITKSREILETLSMMGSSKGQMVLYLCSLSWLCIVYGI